MLGKMWASQELTLICQPIIERISTLGDDYAFKQVRHDNGTVLFFEICQPKTASIDGFWAVLAADMPADTFAAY
jgi:hypothetical protein